MGKDTSKDVLGGGVFVVGKAAAREGVKVSPAKDKDKEIEVRVRVIFSRSNLAHRITPEERIRDLERIFDFYQNSFPGYTVGKIEKCGHLPEACCVTFTKIGSKHVARIDTHTLGMIKHIVAESLSLDPVCVSVELAVS